MGAWGGRNKGIYHRNLRCCDCSIGSRIQRGRVCAGRAYACTLWSPRLRRGRRFPPRSAGLLFRRRHLESFRRSLASARMAALAIRHPCSTLLGAGRGHSTLQHPLRIMPLTEVSGGLPVPRRFSSTCPIAHCASAQVATCQCFPVPGCRRWTHSVHQRRVLFGPWQRKPLSVHHLRMGPYI